MADPPFRPFMRGYVGEVLNAGPRVRQDYGIMPTVAHHPDASDARLVAYAGVPSGSGRTRYRTGHSRSRQTYTPVRRRGYSSKYRGVTVGERKFHDIDVDNGAAVISTTGNIQNSGTIAVIPQGTTEITRIGRKAVIRNINIRWNAFIESGTNMGLTSAYFRMILYWDKQANTATATVLQILESAHWNSFRNLANGERFEILLDKFVPMICTAAAGNGTANDFANTIARGEYFKKCEIPIEYDASLGAITEITSNNICILLISQQALMKFESKVRLRFTDS